MDIAEVKKYLHENPSLIINLLEKLNCTHIKLIPNKRVQCALPDGDNPTSVQVILANNEKLNTVVHTRSEYDGGDILNFVEYMLKCSKKESRNWVGSALGINYINPSFIHKSRFLNILDDFSSNDEDLQHNIPISENSFHQFIKSPHIIFIKDRISNEVQRKMNICYDIEDSRILIPIRDTEGQLITFKGRTVHKDYIEKDIPKYLAYYNYNASEILYGYFENYWDIVELGEAIVVESEKAVLQAMSMGINNVVALSLSLIHI